MCAYPVCGLYAIAGTYYEGELIDELVDVFVCAPIRCVDCTLRGGTKNKPGFWPNDHQ